MGVDADLGLDLQAGDVLLIALGVVMAVMIATLLIPALV